MSCICQRHVIFRIRHRASLRLAGVSSGQRLHLGRHSTGRFSQIPEQDPVISPDRSGDQTTTSPKLPQWFHRVFSLFSSTLHLHRHCTVVMYSSYAWMCCTIQHRHRCLLINSTHAANEHKLKKISPFFNLPFYLTL